MDDLRELLLQSGIEKHNKEDTLTRDVIYLFCSELLLDNTLDEWVNPAYAALGRLAWEISGAFSRLQDETGMVNALVDKVFKGYVFY